MSNRVHILGVPIDSVTSVEAVERILQFLDDQAQHHVMTPNSEMLVAASKDDQFKKLLNQTSLNIPDSAGLLFAAKWTRQHLPERVAGVDTVQAVCAKLDSSHPIFLLGAEEGIAEKAAEELMKQNSSFVIAGMHSGSPKDEDAEGIITMINAAKPHLLLVAYGAPQQDFWIAAHLSEMPSVTVAMGVGGTFDFLADKTKRAPKFFQSLHLEWLWRLLKEPKRIGRICTAVMIFPALVLLEKKKTTLNPYS